MRKNNYAELKNIQDALCILEGRKAELIKHIRDCENGAIKSFMRNTLIRTEELINVYKDLEAKEKGLVL